MRIELIDDGEFKVLSLSDKVGWDDARELEKTITACIDAGQYHIVIHFNDVNFLCSGGIGAIACNLKRVRGLGGDIYLITSNDYVEFVLNSVGFDFIFKGTMFKDKETFDKKMKNKSA